MADIHLISGAVGAGKSTYSRALADASGAVRLSMDAWLGELFLVDIDGPDYPWIYARARRLESRFCTAAATWCRRGIDVVLDIGLMEADQRASVSARLDTLGIRPVWHVLEVPRAVRWARVQERNLIEDGLTVTEGIFDFMEQRSSALDTPDRLASIVHTDKILMWPAAADDAESVDQLLRRAFPTTDEAELVSELAGDTILTLAGGRTGGATSIDAPLEAVLVAVTMRSERGDFAGIAPVAVDPDAQRRGLGAALMREAIARLRAIGKDAVVLLGDPAYYGRFGFVLAARHGIEGQWPGDVFQVLPLGDVQPGFVRYPAAFDRFE